MSVRGVLVSNDSLESLEEFQPDLSTIPKSPKPPRSPHVFNRVDYFDRNFLKGKFSFISQRSHIFNHIQRMKISNYRNKKK